MGFKDSSKAKVNLDSAARLDITCRKGDTFQLFVDFGFDLSDDYQADEWKLQVRTDEDDTGTAVLDLANGGTIFFSIEDGDKANSKLKISVPSSDMDLASGLYVYDLEVLNDEVSPSFRKTWLYGLFTISEDITDQ